MNRTFYEFTLVLTDMEWFVVFAVIFAIYKSLLYLAASSAVKRFLRENSKFSERKIKDFAEEYGFVTAMFVPMKIFLFISKLFGRRGKS